MARSTMNTVNFVRNREREYNEKCRSPNIYMRHKLENCKYLYKKDLFSHYGCVNAIEFSSDGELLASGGDDKRVLLWNVQETISGSGAPHPMKGEHNSNIFCLGFDAKHTKIFSAGNDEQVIVHDTVSGETCDVFLHDEAVYGLSVDPMNDNVFASACDNGRILIWDIREPSTTDPFSLARSSSAFHAVMYNPFEPRLLASANSKEGVGLWDIRKPHCCLLKFGGCISSQSSTSVRFNFSGNYLLALRRRLPPVLYSIASPHPVVEFDHPGYYNSCTMKSCCFAGDRDQYVLSGSDDFKLYCWKIPDEVEDKNGIWVYKAHLVLKGHRSIVNQVRYDHANGIFASSGVEKIVKLWSVYPLPDGRNEKNMRESRKMYTHEEYMNLVIESGQFVTHDYSNKSVHEDPKMMAFFDSLVQRDIEGWTSDSSDSSVNTELLNNCFEVQSSSSSVSSRRASLSSSSSSSLSEDELVPSQAEGNLTPNSVSYISAIASRLQANLQNLSSRENEPDSESSDNRIAKLIAEKRHEQLLKAARTTLKLRKKRWRRNGLPKDGSIKNGSSFKDGACGQSNVHNVFDSLPAASAGSEVQRRRIRVLQKRRARLWRGLSDSDDNTDENTGNNELLENFTNGSVAEATSGIAEPEALGSEQADSRLSPEETNGLNVIATVDATEISENGLTITDACSPSNCETFATSVREEASQDDAASPKLTTFKRFKGNFSSRQYRARNCDD